MDSSFEQLYQQLSEKHRPRLEAMGKSITFKLWIAGGLCTVLALWVLWRLPFIRGYTILIIIIGLICGVVYACKYFLERQYVLYFRENVAKSFVALVDPSLSYSPEPPSNLHSQILDQYHTALFDGRSLLGVARMMIPTNTRISRTGNKMGSHGLSNFITGEIEGCPSQLCCMSLQGLGHEGKFTGLFVRMKVSKNLDGFIKVQRKIQGQQFVFEDTRFIPGTELQKMDSVLFNKDFFVGSNDQITAMQYLTANVMELFLNFKDELINIQKTSADSTNLDFFWQGDDVLMRIGNKKMFMPTMHDPMCKDSLACCVATLNFVTKFNNVITKSIKETAI